LLKIFRPIVHSLSWFGNWFHTSIISKFSGEVKKNPTTPIRHNPIYQTLFLGYPDMPDIQDMKV
jgi:hypothetical protein